MYSTPTVETGTVLRALTNPIQPSPTDTPDSTPQTNQRRKSVTVKRDRVRGHAGVGQGFGEIGNRAETETGQDHQAGRQQRAAIRDNVWRESAHGDIGLPRKNQGFKDIP
jgi:hypothetical protein